MQEMKKTNILTIHIIREYFSLGDFFMFVQPYLLGLTAYRHYQNHFLAQQKAMERLSSGLRINRAADDAAGLAISEKMRAQIRGLKQAARNAQDGISLIRTAEGALQQTHAILQRIRELTVQAANDTNTDEERQNIQMEINQLIDELNRIGNDTEFNTLPLLNGEKKTFKLQIGANTGQSMEIEINDMRAFALNLSNDPNSPFYYDVSSHEKASANLDIIDKAIQKVSSERARLGAYENRLEFTLSNLLNTAENLQAAESRIRDADIAKEFMEYTKRSILLQVSLAMMAQANKQQQLVLKLLDFGNSSKSKH